jgi:hypothetical protein
LIPLEQERQLADLARAADLAYWLRQDVDAQRQRELEAVVGFAFYCAENEEEF